MGFLDGLVSDLIKSSTGINARRFVRRVGGKNILLLGGAAVAGALAADQMGRRETSAPPPPPVSGRKPGTTPPPPVPTSETPAPPLPPVPSEAFRERASPALADAQESPAPGTDAAETLPPDLLWAIVRTMVAAALADGRLADEEKTLVEKRLDASGLSQKRIGQLHHDLVNPPGPEILASLVSNREDAELLYRFGSLVVMADRNVTDFEKMWLDALAGALGIPPKRKEVLEWELFL